MQEQKFCAILKAKLISHGYTVAVPEPDFGEDMWIGTPTEKTKNAPTRTIYRAQAKGVYSYEESKKERKRTYDANDYAITIEYAISQPNFAYFVGIRDERLEQENGAPFHIGCLPVCGFLSEITRQYPGAGVNGDRFFMQFIVIPDNERVAQSRILVNIRRAHNFDVTPYFKDIELGLRVCAAYEAVPQCLVPVPGRRTPA